MGARSFKCLDSAKSESQALASAEEDAIRNLMGPADRFQIVELVRNRNAQQRGVYEKAKAEVRKGTIQKVECATAELGGLPAGLADLDGAVNEFLLFHGTNPAAAKSICTEGFDGGLSSRPVLNFGKGIYFAESSRKADQFAQGTMLICRVTCGHMRRNADWTGGTHSRHGTPPQGSRRGTPTGSRHPTPPGTPCSNSRQPSSITLPALMEALRASQAHGVGGSPSTTLPQRQHSIDETPGTASFLNARRSIDETPGIAGSPGTTLVVFHSTLGHRETAAGIHREFIIEDGAQAFVEYVVHYRKLSAAQCAPRPSDGPAFK